MLKFVKVFKVEVPVWENGVRTEEKETRLKAMFQQARVLNGAVGGKTMTGSMFISRDWTEEMFLKHWDTTTDYSEVLAMEPIEGSDFYKVVVQ